MNSELRKVNEETTKSEKENYILHSPTIQDQESFSPNYRPRRRFLAATIC